MLIVNFISVLIGGIIFISLGYRFARKLVLIKTGWIIIGVLSLLTTAGVVYLGFYSGFTLLLIILLGPMAIVAGLIATLAFGIGNLIIGFGKVKNVTKITNGFILIGINLTIIAALIVLLVMFTTGVIPIRFM